MHLSDTNGLTNATSTHAFSALCVFVSVAKGAPTTYPCTALYDSPTVSGISAMLQG